MVSEALHHSSFSLVLSVIVVAADSGHALRDCVCRLMDSELPLEVIVVDNASDDGVPGAVARAYESDMRLTMICNHANIGFGPAVNQAALKARGTNLLILNPDCMVDQAGLRRLLEIAEAYPHAGLIGAVVCSGDGTPDPASWRRDPLLRRSLNSLLGLAGEKVNVERNIPASVFEVEAVSGALMLIPRATFQDLGGFDEKFFLHCEDLDLCRRVRDGGYQVLLAGDVRVLHHQGSSSRHRPVFVSRHKHRGMWRWFRKHDPMAARPVLATLVWLGVWAHFLLQLPAQWINRSQRQ